MRMRGSSVGNRPAIGIELVWAFEEFVPDQARDGIVRTTPDWADSEGFPMSQITAASEAPHAPLTGGGEPDAVIPAAPVAGRASVHGGTAWPPDVPAGPFHRPGAAWRLVGPLRYDLADVARRVATMYAVPVDRIQAEIEEFVANLIPDAMSDGTRGREFRDCLSDWSFSAARSMKRPLRHLPAKVRLWMLMTATRLLHVTLGWSRTAGLVAGLFPRTAARPPRADWEAAVRRIDARVRDVARRHPLSPGTAEKALCCWALLRSDGWPADLVAGVDVFPALGRYWCQSGPWTLGDDPRVIERFVPVIRYS
jgi:hypothetical protein